MKHIKFIFIFWISLLSLETISKAGDVKEYKIEDLSVGESLLSFYSSNQIESFAKDVYELPEKNKWIRYYIDLDFDNYQYLSADIKIGDKDLIIYGLTGMIDFDDNNRCIAKQKEIKMDLEGFFETEPKEYEFKSAYDKTGESIIYNVRYNLDNGIVAIQCYDFAEHVKIQGGLDFTIRLNKFDKWLLQK